MPAPSPLSGGDVFNGRERRGLAHRDIECDDAPDRGQSLAEVIGVSPHGDLKAVAVEAQHCLAEVTSNQSGANAGARTLGQVGRHSVGDGNRVAVQGQRRGATTNSLQIGVVEESTVSGGGTTSAFEFLQTAHHLGVGDVGHVRATSVVLDDFSLQVNDFLKVIAPPLVPIATEPMPLVLRIPVG